MQNRCTTIYIGVGSGGGGGGGGGGAGARGARAPPTFCCNTFALSQRRAKGGMNYVATLTFVSKLPWSECYGDLDADVSTIRTKLYFSSLAEPGQR